LFLILAALAASPAVAAPTTPERPSANIARDPIAALDSEMSLYGQWLARVMAVEQRVQQQLIGLQPVWQQGMNLPPGEGIPRLRAYIRNALAAIDAADAEVATIAGPALPHFELPEDLRPPAIIRQVRQLNRDIRAVVAGYLPLIDSFSHPQQTEAAARNLVGSLRLVFVSQLVMARAAQTATPRDQAEWEIAGFQISFLRAAERIFSAFDPMQNRIDASLPADLMAIADELDAAVARAREKLTDSLGTLDRLVTEAERLAEISSVAVLRRARTVIALGRDSLPLASQLAASLREGAAIARGRQITPELLIRIFAPLRAIRTGFNEIAMRQSRAMAESP
jgi:hypothetical protein